MAAIRESATSELKTDTEIAHSAVTVKVSGRAESGATTELDGFLERLRQSAVTAKVPEVVFDMRGLDFLSSSCFKQLVTWINTLQELPADAQYRVRFVADEKKHWQSRSLGALACFAVDLVRIES